MIPLKVIRQEPDLVKTGVANKGADPSQVDEILKLDESLRALTVEVEGLKAERNRLSQEIGALKRDGKDASELMEATGNLAEKIKGLDTRHHEEAGDLEKALLWLPNLPHASTPVGTGAAQNREVATWGEPLDLDFEGKDQHDLLVDLQLVDFEAGGRISGRGFPVYMDRGARLERALINFMLDLQTKEHGYREVMPPYLVTRQSMLTTGQLPKLEDDMYVTTSDDLFLIPTAEVPLTNLYQGQTMDESDLPLKFAATSACFRREAGSYGKDTRGLLRVHQFNKVELVKFVHPDNSYEELEALRRDAEEVLKRLGLAYRVIELCTGDLSFAAARCYDLELYAPVTARWLEVSSCSNYEAFQARRGGIRYRSRETGKLDYPHTLNGSGVATPRLMAALLETCQQADGSVRLPEVLVPYYGEDTIAPE